MWLQNQASPNSGLKRLSLIWAYSAIWACGKFELDSKEKDVLRQIQEFLCIREIFTSSDPRSAVILHHKQQNFFFEESPY